MDAVQKQINQMMGISDEVFVKYNPPATGEIEKARAKLDLDAAGLTETQLVINKMLGISEETWKKYNTTKKTQEAKRDGVVTIIPKLNFQGHKEVRHG